MNRTRFCLAACVAGALALGGCATTDQRVNLLYKPVVTTAKGSGELYLAAEKQESLPKTGEIQWILGSVTDSDGQKKGNVVSPQGPEDLLLDAFKQELTAAGYRVLPVAALPKGAAKGVSIARVDLVVDETASIVKAEVAGRVKVVVDLWKGGNRFKRLEYGVKQSDFAVKDRELLPEQILRQNIETVMQQAIPEITGLLESAQPGKP